MINCPNHRFNIKVARTYFRKITLEQIPMAKNYINRLRKRKDICKKCWYELSTLYSLLLAKEHNKDIYEFFGSKDNSIGTIAQFRNMLFDVYTRHSTDNIEVIFSNVDWKNVPKMLKIPKMLK